MGREREALYLLPGLGNTQEVKWGAAKSVLFVWHGPELRLGHYKSPEQQRQDETCVKPQNQSVSGGWPAFTSWTHTHTHTPICTSTHVNTPSCEHTHTTTGAHADTHPHKHTHTNTHTNTHFLPISIQKTPHRKCTKPWQESSFDFFHLLKREAISMHWIVIDKSNLGHWSTMVIFPTNNVIQLNTLKPMRHDSRHFNG